MSRHLQLTSWNAELAKRFPHFPAPVVTVLALYSLGVLLAHASGLSRVVLFLHQHFGGANNAWRKRLREFYLDAPDKSGVRQGHKRSDFDVTTAFAALLRWALSLWAGQALPLAIDVTNLGERFHVLCVSVVVQGTALPVAWKVLAGGQKEPWHPHWVALLSCLRPAVPDTWTVIVLSDRGLESPPLFQEIVALGWHPIMRVKKGGKFRPSGWRTFYYLQQLAACPNQSLAVTGQAYVGVQLRCTLLARWEEGYHEPWLVLTDLPPEAAMALWYGLRTWIEQGFKVIKGGGWAWDKTRMEGPTRVERLWLVLAVATLWVTSVGIVEEVRREQQAEQHCLERALSVSAEQARRRQEHEQRRREQQEAAHQARQQKRQQAKATRRAKKAEVGRRKRGATAKGRGHRVSVVGLAVLMAAWARGENPLPQALHPEPWPRDIHPVATLNEQDFL